MAEDLSPYIKVDKSQRLQEIVAEFEEKYSDQPQMSLGEAKRIELIRKMKQDTDKKEYMMMFNALMISLSVISIAHFVVFGSIFSLAVVIICLIYFIYIRRRLTKITLSLSDHKNNFDKYLWEGFYLKEMRFSAVKLAYLIFFPLLMVFITDIISNNRINLWLGIVIAAVISSLAWFIFFSDDRSALEGIESDLKSLEFLG